MLRWKLCSEYRVSQVQKMRAARLTAGHTRANGRPLRVSVGRGGVAGLGVLASQVEQFHCFDDVTVSGSPLIRVLSVSGLGSEESLL